MIPFHKPFKLKQYDRAVIFNKIDNMLDSGKLSNGNHVRILENQISHIHGVDHVIATSSCTQALMICLKYALEKSYGNNYLQTTPFTWESINYLISTYDIIWRDIHSNTWLINKENQNLSLYLHTFGNIGVSKSEDVIYDGSHCLGAKFKDLGLATCISLAPTKMITSMEGGLILTNDVKLYNFSIEYRDKCCRMSEVHAIFGLQYLRHLEEVLFFKKRSYNQYKRNIPGQFQEIPNNSNYNTIGFLNIDKLKIPDDIETKQYYVPLLKGLKNTDFVHENMVCLPSWYNAPIGEIIDKIKELNDL